jgi:DNA-binding IclR family transcriptional regulator
VSDTTTIAKAVKLPTTTARRALEELVIYGLAMRDPQGPGRADLWRTV